MPDESIDKAISYFVKMTASSGQVAYSGGIGGFNESLARISIGTLVYAIARRKDLPQYKQTLNYLKDKIGRAAAAVTVASSTKVTIRPRRSFKATSMLGTNGTKLSCDV